MPQFTYASEPHLEIDGQPATEKLLEDVLQISIEESLHLPSMFTIVVKNAAFPGQTNKPTLSPGGRNEEWEHAALFEIGKSIRIGFTNSATEANEFDEQEKKWLLSGEITAIETHFTSGSQAPMIIRGYDSSHRLHRGSHNRSFQNMTDTDIVSTIVREVGISTGTLDQSGNPHDYIFQENQTNMEFLRERAARNGFELFVQDAKLHFRKPKQDEALELTWLKELTSFQVRVTSAEQVNEVEVRGWDYKQQKAIVATCSRSIILTETQYGKGQKTSSVFQGKPTSPKLIVVDQPIYNQQEADKMAQALFNELSDEFVHADARAQGHPAIRPGRVVTLKGMGKYSGKYYITETHHIFSERIYTTAFSVRGLRGGDLFSLLSPPNRLNPGQTLLIGKVTNNSDPENMGRVRVKFPTLTEEHESHWARVVTIGAGKDRGFDCLPEIDDEVLVGFEHGDIHRPYVIGGLWNGNNSPPEKVGDSVTSSKVRVRTFKTRTGHQMQFVEEDKGSSKKGIYITTIAGSQIHANDSDKFVEVKTIDGHKLRFDDASKTVSMTSTGDVETKAGGTGASRKISLKAGEISLTGTQKITLSVGASIIEVSATGIKLQAPKIDIQGAAMVQIQGALIKLN
ncbi:MAG: VgrG-related protein [Scytolyngbya sp. HA4215-MV1]|jgi:phage protein D/phage baseplate assembly protein gpV|nr:VgrG-related protein [Scytolyngbya sp. HA4215-MV1]